MALAGSLEIQLSAGIARLQSDLNQAKGVVTSATQHIESAVATAKNALGALGIGLGVGYFVSLIKGSIDAMDHLNDLSKTLDISVEKLSGLKLLAKQSGGDLDSLAASIAKLSVNAGKDAEKYAALGITAKDNVEAFKQLADVIGRTVDPQQKAAIAQAALGKSWMGSMPALSEGSKRIEEIIEKGARLAKTNEVMTKAADDFNDTLAEISAASAGTVSSLVGGLLPAMTMVAHNFELVRNLALSFIAVPVVLWLTGIATAAYAKVAAMVASVVALQAERAATISATAANVAQLQSVLASTGAEVARTAAIVAEATVAENFARSQLMHGPRLATMQAQLAAATAAHTVALNAQAVTTAGLTAAQAAHSTALAGSGVAATALSRALGLLGGPIGLITLALGLGATAWAFWGKSAEDAAGKAEESLKRALALSERLRNEQKFGAGNVGVLTEGLAVAKQKLQVELDSLEAARAAAKTTAEQSMVEKAYSKSVIEAQKAVNQLEGDLEKAGKATAGLTDEQKKQAAANAAFLKENKDGTKAIKETESAYRSLMKALEEKLLQDKDRTEFARLEITLQNMTEEALNKLTGAEIAALAVAAKKVDANNAAKKAIEDETKALMAYAEWLEKVSGELAAAIAQEGALRDQAVLATEKTIAQIQFETTLIGLSNEQREIAIALREIEISGIKKEDEAYAGLAERVRAVLASKQAAQAIVDLNKKALDEFKSMWSEVERTGKGVFIALANGGENMASRVGAAIKSSIIDLLYQMTVRKWIIEIGTTAAGLAGIGSSASSAASAGSSGMNLLSAGSTLSSLFNGGVAFGQGFAQTAFVPAAEAAAMIEAGTVGAAGAGMEAGALMSSTTWIPYVGAAVLAAYLLFGRGKPTVQGWGSTTVDSTGQFSAMGSTMNGFDFNPVLNMAGAAVAQFTTIVKQLGGTISQSFGIGIGQAGGGQFNVVPDVGGVQLYDRAGLDATQMQLESVRAILVGLQQAADFPDYLHRVFAAMDAGTASIQQINDLIAFANVLKDVHDRLNDTRLPFQILRDEADKLAHQLGATVETFKLDFTASINDLTMTPAQLANWQRLANMIDTINEAVAAAASVQEQFAASFESSATALNHAQVLVQQEANKLGVPTLATDPRQAAYLMRNANPATQEGQSLIAELNALAPQFKLVYDAIAQASAEALEEARAIAQQRADLERQVMEAEGNTVEIRRLELAALDPSNRALQQRIYDLADEAVQMQKAADAKAAADARAQIVAGERAGLEKQILQLLGDTAALRRLEIEALDPSNRALQERIHRLTDEAVRTQAAAQAAEQLAQAAAQRGREVAQERASLETQILQLLGDTTELRRQELASLNPTNRALQTRIYQLTDEADKTQKAKDAQAAADAAAQAVAQQRSGLERQVLQLLGDTAELRRQEVAALDPSNRALQERIYQLSDEAEKTRAAKESQAASIAQARAVASERENLQRQELQLLGRTNELRAAELAATSMANRTLQERIYQLTDEAAIAQQARGLQQQILQLQGNTYALRAAELSALDPVNRGLQEMIYALQDMAIVSQAAAQATQDAEAARQAARQAEEQAQAEQLAKDQSITSQRESLMTQILTLEGNTAALREREIMALDPSNRALQLRIYALQDEATATQAAAAAQQAADAKAQAIAAQGDGLLKQALQLLGDTAAIREMELAALDPANRALQKFIYMLQDQASATQEATQASQAHIQAQQQIKSWLASNALSGLSPLTPQQQFASARSNYDSMLRRAGGGDASALAGITQAADALLAAYKAMGGFTGGYSALFAEVRSSVGSLARTDMSASINTNVIQLRTSVDDLKAVLARLMERGNSDANANADDIETAIEKAAERQAAAAERIAAIGGLR